MQETCLIPRLQRSPGEGNGYLLQYSSLENSMDSIVHGAAKSWTPLSNFQKQNARNLQGAPLSLSCILNHLSLVWPKKKWDAGSWKNSIFCTGKSGFEALTSLSGKKSLLFSRGIQWKYQEGYVSVAVSNSAEVRLLRTSPNKAEEKPWKDQPFSHNKAQHCWKVENKIQNSF